MTVKYLLRKILPTWAKTLSEEIAKLVITPLVAAAAVWCAFLIPIARSWLSAQITTNIGVVAITSLTLFVTGGAFTMLLLRRRIKELSALAATDDLTQTLNSREVQRRLREEVSRSKRQQGQFCLILIDIDNLKTTNDTYGYAAGDDMLREFAQLAKSKVRLPDVVGRYRQGDEFAILALDTEAIKARVVTERLRGETEGYNFYAKAKRSNFKITFSAGMATFDCNNDSVESLEKHAELALAAAKRTKNAVAIYDASMEAGARTLGGIVGAIDAI